MRKLFIPLVLFLMAFAMPEKKEDHHLDVRR